MPQASVAAKPAAKTTGANAGGSKPLVPKPALPISSGSEMQTKIASYQEDIKKSQEIINVENGKIKATQALISKIQTQSQQQASLDKTKGEVSQLRANLGELTQAGKEAKAAASGTGKGKKDESSEIHPKYLLAVIAILGLTVAGIFTGVFWVMAHYGHLPF